MKNILLYIALTSLIFQSCEDVIRVDLNSSDPQLVIEGNVNNLGPIVSIRISETTDYFSPEANLPVSSAQVSITDDQGKTKRLIETVSGTYQAPYIGMPGHTYKLQVQTGNVTYSASSIMPRIVPVDSLWLSKQSTPRGQTEVINCRIHDPAGVPNYYYVQLAINDSLIGTGDRFILFSDKYSDGAVTNLTINARRLGIDKPFASSDRIRVYVQCIDYNTYEYLKELQSILDQSFLSASTPANPTNNISPSALGYFSARSISSKLMVVP